MKYLLVTIGCIECGDDTEIGNIVSKKEIPKEYKIVQLNSFANISYADSQIAIELAGIY